MSDVVTTDINYYNSTYKLNDISTVVGKMVLMEIVEQDNQEKMGDIFITSQHKENFQMLKGKIIALGNEAKTFGLNVDDIVLYDRWSCFFKPPFVAGIRVITEYNNILGKHVED